MDFKGLQIGNYLHDRENNLCKIIELGVGTIYAPALGNVITKLTNKPIPLSEEWMLKFGFNVEECFYFKNGVWLELLEDFEFRIEGFDLDNKIKYVHQLQNLYFSLTGEELILKELV